MIEMIKILEAFVKEGYTVSSVKVGGGKSGNTISLLRKGDLTVAISCDRYGHKFYVAEENSVPVSFHKNFLEVEKWKGNSYGIKKDGVFQPSDSEALTLLADVPHYSQISILDFVIFLSQK